MVLTPFDPVLVREERQTVLAEMQAAHRAFAAAPRDENRAILLKRVLTLTHQHSNLLAWERHLDKTESGR